MFSFSSITFRKLFFFYISCIIILLVLPLNGTINLSEVYFGFRSDHIVHCLIFTPFMLLCYLGKVAIEQKLLFTYGYGFATFCESLHLVIPYRNASMFDFFANCIGITLSILILKLAQHKHWLRTIDS